MNNPRNSCFPRFSLLSVLVTAFLLLPHASFFVGAQYAVGDQSDYLDDFELLTEDSYGVPLPAGMAACQGSVKGPGSPAQVSIDEDMNAAEFQGACGSSSTCVVEEGVTVTLDGNVNVAAIINKGTIEWTDESQTAEEQWLCSGFVVTELNGVFNLTVTSEDKHAYIYLKNNGAKHPHLSVRAFGGSRVVSDPAQEVGYPIVEVTGRPLRRTWSLLSHTANEGTDTLHLMHDVEDMGWRVGDRIAIAPTKRQSQGNAQAFFIKDINKNRITLAADDSLSTTGYTDQEYLGRPERYMQAEVLMMSRNVIITGDDFEHVNCVDDQDVCPCQGNNGRVCTVGSHTMLHGNGERQGGTYRVQYARVEKCGHRGATARYCIHFHLMRDCPDCLARGNAVEFSHQRGIVVHGTHLAQVIENTLYDVRGAGIYIEDGNELHNHVEYNAVLCPHSFTGDKNGCTIPGTDNAEADTDLNHAAYWSLSHTNHFLGNRAANSFNGIFFHPSFDPDGRGTSAGKVCTINLPLGRVEGNTCHGHGRFGTYFVSSDWPRRVETSLDENGWTSQCDPFDDEGYSRGLPAVLSDNVDYHNTWVGSYHLGDIQFRNHIAIDNNQPIYHKETKNFADGCSAHFKNYLFEAGTAALASGHGTILFEDCTFKGNFKFESNHHCDIGVTGVLCNPQYIFIRPTFELTSSVWIDWNAGESPDENPTLGSIYALSPEDAANPDGIMFPPGYQSLVHGAHDYLLDLDDKCVTASSVLLGVEWDGGIICKGPLRRLDIYTQGLTEGSQGTVTVEVHKNGQKITEQNMRFNKVGGTNKEGFTIPVLADLDYQYVVHRNGGNIPSNWIIEFSDPVIGNRWEPDQIRLDVQGRSCPDITTSQHDRRWIYADDVNHFDEVGRGACTAHPDMPEIDCAEVPEISLLSCPELCSEECPENAYCDCGTGECRCEAGFFGPDCQRDICASARCGPHGKCTSRYLGGTLAPASAACVCEPPFTGPTCEANPCEGVTCSGNGVCMPLGETAYYCQCNNGFNGDNCENTCDGFCAGNWPYGCNAGTGGPSFCNSGGGCSYQESDFSNPNLCCFTNCEPCRGVSCEPPEHDCLVPSYCDPITEVCMDAVPRAEGSVCHSEPWGTCEGGICVEGETPDWVDGYEDDVGSDGGDGGDGGDGNGSGATNAMRASWFM
ncbi:G8 domain-containing protein [Balamuthia mandrillaris]